MRGESTDYCNQSRLIRRLLQGEVVDGMGGGTQVVTAGGGQREQVRGVESGRGVRSCPLNMSVNPCIILLGRIRKSFSTLLYYSACALVRKCSRRVSGDIRESETNNK